MITTPEVCPCGPIVSVPSLLGPVLSFHRYAADPHAPDGFHCEEGDEPAYEQEDCRPSWQVELITDVGEH